MHRHLLHTIGLPLLLIVSAAHAKEIHVAPGERAISKAVKQAAAGDVIVLQAGAYEDAITLPAGVTLRGAGPDKTVLKATEWACISVGGPGVRIEGIELRPGAETERAINADEAVRIERCRFRKFPSAVALMGAPLSDIVHCEFVQCDIGVRAIGHASPTVWGCSFTECRVAIYIQRGGPYIRNNLIRGGETGILIMAGDPPTIRNCVFFGCQDAAIKILRAADLFQPSIRNVIVSKCKSAIVGPAEATSGVSHMLLHDVSKPPFVTKDRAPTLDPTKYSIVTVDPGLSVAGNGTVSCKNDGAVRGKGAPHCHPEGSPPGDFGLERNESRPGCAPLPTAHIPPIRFEGKVHLSNAVSEEYQAIAMWGYPRPQMHASLSADHGGLLSQHTCDKDGKEVFVTFDPMRFFCETRLQRFEP